MNQIAPNSFRNGPDENGRFGIFGGRFVAETLMPLVLDLEQAYARAKVDPAFHAELQGLHKHYVGRPSPLYFAERITEHLRAQAGEGLGAKVYFKRDELNHTGAHKINNVLGQILLARRMGKQRIIAETGAGQHGVATATACARFGLKCVVYMGAVDVERQKPNVFRMKMLGAEVIPVQSGARTLKDAMNEALRDWVTNVADTFYCIGTAAGPHPYPAMVRDFQSIIGTETRAQMQEMEGRLPDSLVACIGGGSNAIGLFHPFLDDAGVEIYGVEAAGHGVDVPNGHAASLTGGRPGVLHGNRTYLLMDDDGQILEGHSISAGLDYPGIGPEHSWLHESGRVEISQRDRQGGAERLSALLEAGGHHPGAGAFPRAGQGVRTRAAKAEGSPDGDEHVRPRRQGHFHRRGDFGRDVRAAPFRGRRFSRAGARAKLLLRRVFVIDLHAVGAYFLIVQNSGREAKLQIAGGAVDLPRSQNRLIFTAASGPGMNRCLHIGRNRKHGFVILRTVAGIRHVCRPLEDMNYCRAVIYVARRVIEHDRAERMGHRLFHDARGSAIREHLERSREGGLRNKKQSRPQQQNLLHDGAFR